MSAAFDKNLSTVLAVAVASTIQVAVTEGAFTLWNVMIGAVLICVLLTYRSASRVTIFEVGALSTVWGLNIVITIGVFVQWLFPNWPRDPENHEIRPRYFFYIWLIATTVIFVVALALNARKPANSPQGTA
jgi:hypothetical protein